MSLLTDAIVWIASSIGFLLCVSAIIGYRITRRRPLSTESYHDAAERAYLAATTASPAA